MNRFEELGIGGKTIKAITELGFETPTSIQEQAIPVLLKGNKDLVGLAQTGTGKTAAFGLPLVQLIDFNSKDTRALILCPTRELCMQITKDLQKYTKYIDGANIVAIYGGASIDNQTRDIRKGAQIIVATPGRMVDMLERKRINLQNVKWVVLDEADEMLNMGFKEDLSTILSETPKEKNTWLFSATMPNEVSRIAKKYMTNPHEITIGNKNQGAENIQHLYYIVHARDKYLALKRIADYNPDIFAIVFCRTKIETQEIADALIKDGYNADALHGDLSQAQRDHVMKRYRSKSLQMLVATDVAARGIDVNDVTHVINYNLPDEIENYTHRSGRTARAGKSGVSIVIINMKEIGKIRLIERIVNKKFTHALVPNGFEVCEKQLFHLVKKIHNVEVNEKEIETYLPKIYEELADLSKEELIKRFVSAEFNMFLDYYKNAPDINTDIKKERGNIDNGRTKRLFLNIGQMDGLDRASLKEFICKTANLENSLVIGTDVKNTFSFLEVDIKAADLILAAFKNEKFNDRFVKIEMAGNREEGRGEGGGRNRYKSYSSQSTGQRSHSGSGDRGHYRSTEKSFSGRSYSERGTSSISRSSNEGNERKKNFTREKRPRKKL